MNSGSNRADERVVHLHVRERLHAVIAEEVEELRRGERGEEPPCPFGAIAMRAVVSRSMRTRVVERRQRRLHARRTHVRRVRSGRAAEVVLGRALRRVLTSRSTGRTRELPRQCTTFSASHW